MHNAIAHYASTNAQLVPERQSSLPHSPQFIYWAWHPMVCNIPLASLGQLSWLCHLPTPCGWAWEAEKSLIWYKHYLATTENISVLSTLFSNWIQNLTLYQLVERKLTLSQLKPGQNVTCSFNGLNIHAWVFAHLYYRSQYLIQCKLSPGS